MFQDCAGYVGPNMNHRRKCKLTQCNALNSGSPVQILSNIHSYTLVHVITDTDRNLTLQLILIQQCTLGHVDLFDFVHNVRSSVIIVIVFDG